MPVTIHDVAERAGVGIGTVSSVLNDSRPVNEETRQKVLEAIAELDFVPNPSGRRLSIGKTQTVAVVITFFTSASQIERLRGAMSVIVESDYEISLFVVETIAQRNKVLQTVPHRGRVDGLLIFSLSLTEDEVRRIHQQAMPVILVESAHPDFSHIALDDTTGARQAVQYLIDLGHQNVAYIGENLNQAFRISFDRNRYRGYCQALEAAALPVKPPYYFRQGKQNRQDGRRMALELLQADDPPTAIFTYSDELALGVLEAARDLDLKVPGELSVVGYDDTELAPFAQLTTVRQHLFDSGVKGVELLLEAIHQPEIGLSHLQLPTELVVRQTTAPPHRRQS